MHFCHLWGKSFFGGEKLCVWDRIHSTASMVYLIPKGKEEEENVWEEGGSVISGN